MSSTIQDAFRPTTKKGSSSKTPAFYNAAKNRLILGGATSSKSEVRMFFASNASTPTKVLAVMLQDERDKQILRTVMMNPNMSRKAVAQFINNETDERVSWFDDDQELADHFRKE